jgi:hypothetical protein
VSSLMQERRRALPVVDAANAQKLILSREKLNDEQLDTVARTAMETLYRETYYENGEEETKGEKKNIGTTSQNMQLIKAPVSSYDQSRVIKAMALTTALSVSILLITLFKLWPFVIQLVVSLGVLYSIYSTTDKSVVADKMARTLAFVGALLQVTTWR